MSIRPAVHAQGFEYRATLLEVLAGIAGALQYQRQLEEIEAELFDAPAPEDFWLLAA